MHLTKKHGKILQISYKKNLEKKSNFLVRKARYFLKASEEKGGGCLQEKTDNELMGMAAGGDKDAFEILVLRYYGEALRYLRSRMPNKEAAQDIAQDCFADIWAARERYRMDFSFRTYFYAVMKHKLMDYRRRAGRESGGAEMSEIEEIILEDSPEAACLRKERKNEMAEWIAALPPQQKRALLLYAAEGMSYQEIAVVMQKNVLQIKSAIHRARTTLRKRRDGR